MQLHKNKEGRVVLQTKIKPAATRFHLTPAPGVHATYCGAERRGEAFAVALKPEHVPPERRTCAECQEGYALAHAPTRYRVVR